MHGMFTILEVCDNINFIGIIGLTNRNMYFAIIFFDVTNNKDLKNQHIPSEGSLIIPSIVDNNKKFTLIEISMRSSKITKYDFSQLIFRSNNVYTFNPVNLSNQEFNYNFYRIPSNVWAVATGMIVAIL